MFYCWAGQDHGYLEGHHHSVEVHQEHPEDHQVHEDGWFSSEPNVKVYDLHEGTEPEKKQATMEVKGNKLTVTRGKQKDYQWNRKQGPAWTAFSRLSECA
ncbi:inter-alpha-trypsin inhibitor heavy chain H2-like [Clarias gariepinus]|uniref:inter-alpha-trypsin inhibitor heavy chain H2-like n=1 Tax=Clarias gariepinus TaxID=13013 RepID=UPI00234C533A|nr:inter-alpha-trypsin inhibitor heavy chain H2-like [Clarias gariepinus]